MKKLIATLAMMASVTASADGLIGMGVYAYEANSDDTVNVHGKCGNAFVAITGVDVRDEFVVGQYGSEFVMVNPNTGKEFKTKLNDYNKLACFVTAKGYRVVYGTACGGSKCGDVYDYHVVDTNTMRVLNKKPVQETNEIERVLNGK